MAKNIRAKFFEEQRETTKVALVEISIIGDPSTVVLKVTEEHKEQFPDEWKAFAGGKDDVVTDGTPLTDVKGIGPKLASKLKVVGMSAYTHRQSARELLNLVPDSVGSIAP